MSNPLQSQPLYSHCLQQPRHFHFHPSQQYNTPPMNTLTAHLSSTTTHNLLTLLEHNKTNDFDKINLGIEDIPPNHFVKSLTDFDLPLLNEHIISSRFCGMGNHHICNLDGVKYSPFFETTHLCYQ